MGSSETLRSVIDAGRTAKRLDELSTARVICKIAEQVHAAQQKAGAGKAIGPITPAGIAIETTGAAKLGLAEPTATAYSSPEQVAGGGGDRRSDVFSLGAVMFEALTHEPLFEGNSKLALEAAVKDQAIISPAELNANIPAELGAICMKALARNPAERYQSAKVMAAEIEAVLDDAGYGDSDDKIAEFIATLGQPKKEIRVTLPPPLSTPAQGVGVGVDPAVPTAKLDRTTQPDWPPVETARQPAKTEPPPMAAARVHSQPTQPPVAKQDAKPSILDKPPTSPPPSMSSPSAGSLSPTSFLKAPDKAPDKPGANLATALANAGAKPLPSVVSSATVTGFASGATDAKLATADALSTKADSPGAISDSMVTNVVGTSNAFDNATTSVRGNNDTIPEVAIKPGPSIANAVTVATPGLAAAFAPTPSASPVGASPVGASNIPASNIAASNLAASKVAASTTPGTPGAVPLVPAAPIIPAAGSKNDKPSKRAQTNPNPASVVSLPAAGKAGRESQEVLEGWGWGTDSHASLQEYDDSDDQPAEPNRKLLFYAIGGGLCLAAIITVIAIGFGGSSSSKPAPTAATKEGVANGSSIAAKNMGSDIAYGSNSVAGAIGSDTTANPAANPSGADTVSGADTASGANPSGATPSGSNPSATGSDTTSGAVAMSGSGSNGSVATTKPDTTATTKPDATAATKPDTTATTKPDTTKPDTTKPDTTKPDTAATKPDKTKPDTIATAKPDKTKPDTTKPDKTTPKTRPDHRDTHATNPVAHADKPDTTSSSATEVEAAYRQGLQLFARGDTNGALASLRTSLAGNPSYAPTWRGLGLVFEKMGEKDQARSAFKRYLQLAPSAGDAEQIRNRLERLGS